MSVHTCNMNSCACVDFFRPGETLKRDVSIVISSNSFEYEEVTKVTCVLSALSLILSASTKGIPEMMLS